MGPECRRAAKIYLGEWPAVMPVNRNDRKQNSGQYTNWSTSTWYEWMETQVLEEEKINNERIWVITLIIIHNSLGYGPFW
jgi:hypothetical protein